MNMMGKKESTCLSGEYNSSVSINLDTFSDFMNVLNYIPIYSLIYMNSIQESETEFSKQKIAIP